MKFFDANCCLGKLSVPMPKSIETAKELYDMMEKAGIEKSLVYHSFAKEYDPTFGNRKLMEVLTSFQRSCVGTSKNLYPCLILVPHHTEEMPEPEKVICEILEKNIRAVRIFPKTHNWSLSEWCSGKLLNELEQKTIPLFIDIEETSWEQAYSLCAGHPKLPIVLTQVPFRFSRQIYSLLAQTSNLYIETSHFQLHCGIEDVCKKFGAKQLLFGTSSPFFAPSPSMMAIKYANISEEEKELIASKNLMKLLKL